MKKSDILAAFIIGEGDALLTLFIVKNIEESIFSLPGHIIYLIKLLPLILPILAVLGITAAYLISKKFPVVFQIAKFLGIGSFNTLIDLGVLNILMMIFRINAGMVYSIFKGFSFICATTNSYFWNKFWTFKNRETPCRKKEVLKFLIVASGGFLINVATASFVVNIIGPQFGVNPSLWANIGGIIAAFAVAALEFCGYKFLVFKK